MRVWSRGLGRVELAADLKRVKVVYDGGTLFIVGKSEPPVSWDFVVSIDSSELWRVSRVVLNRHGVGFTSKYLRMRLFDRRKLSADLARATVTRTGIKPEQEYARILAKARPQKRGK